MNERETPRENEEIFSKVLRAGRRTYFFDVRSTKADDYYLTITESKRYANEDGSIRYKKHKVFLYKEDFENFKGFLEEATDYVFQNRGEDVISDKLQLDSDTSIEHEDTELVNAESNENFTSIEFEDL